MPPTFSYGLRARRLSSFAQITDAMHPTDLNTANQVADLAAKDSRSLRQPNRPAVDAAVLALDTGSPTVSVAVGRAGRCLAEQHRAIERSSELLIGIVDEVLQGADVALSELGGMAVLCGPGSFTGLRVGLATIVGFEQCLGLPVTTLPSLAVLATAAHLEGQRGLVAGAVDALRGDWFVQLFDASQLPPCPMSQPQRLTAQELPSNGVAAWIGFGISRLPVSSPTLIEPPPLAPAALRLAACTEWSWTAEHLYEPLYLQAPNVTLPKRRPARTTAGPKHKQPDHEQPDHEQPGHEQPDRRKLEP
jgi:tRNA threonylcarbamoyl adenosine modification protein YeaZ